MMADKLTALAERRAHSRVAYGYIVRAKPGLLQELVETARQYELAGLVRRSVLEDLMGQIVPYGALGVGLKVFPRFRMVAGIFSREVVFDMAEWAAVERIYPDEPKWALQYTVPPEGVYETRRKVREPLVFTSTYWTKRLIGADVANEKGYRGEGMLVCVADTGARRTHEQIRGRVRFETTLRGQHMDGNGHGTWCATCIGGSRAIDDVASRMVGRTVLVEGMAPACDLVAVKCLGYAVGFGTDSSIIEAMHVALDYGADVINLSLGGPVEVERVEDDPYYWVFEEVRKTGAIPCVAAGNEGPEPGTVATPGWLPNVLTVGAWDPIEGRVADFSSRGPTPDGRPGVDCIAPGVNVDSGICGQLDLAADHVTNRYSPISGTSMATPHVAGLVALMKQAIRKVAPWVEWNLDRVLDMLEKTAPHPQDPALGWGMITWQRFEEYCETELGVRI